MAGGNKLRVKVKPDLTNEPQVHLDSRDPDGKPKIRWIKDDDAEDFDFIAFAPNNAPLQNPFKNIEVNSNRIKCNFEPADGDEDEEFKYTIYIEVEGVAYESDDDTGPADGKAVIRN